MAQQKSQRLLEPNPSSKVIRHLGTLWGTDVGGVPTSIFIADGMEADAEAGVINSAVGAVIGILVSAGVLIYRKVKQLRRNKDIPVEDLKVADDLNNPWNARVKAGVVFGEGIGRTVFACLPIPMAEKPLLMLGSAVGGFIGGIIALFIPGWKPSVQEPFQNTELNPSSERIRSGAMYGSCVGIVFAVFFVALTGILDISAVVLLGAGIGAALGSFLAYCLNEGDFFDKSPPNPEKPNANETQNPWSKRIRAGVQWAACLGILLGVLFPGLGLGLSVGLSPIVGGALFSVLGGVVSLFVEPLVTSFLIPSVSDKDYRTVNPWVPRCRAGVAWGTCLGTLIGCFIFPGFFGATAAGAIGGLVGGFVAVVVEPIYLLLNKEEGYKAVESDDPKYVTPNPWAERCRTGTLVFAALGALIGYFLFPPLAVFLGSAMVAPLGMLLGGAIGGVLGGVVTFFLPSSEIESRVDVAEFVPTTGQVQKSPVVYNRLLQSTEGYVELIEEDPQLVLNDTNVLSSCGVAS
jgi:hypothetical protein